MSQLNLGYITRVNHIEGRKDFRGEGFELRTDGWGAIRAAKGLFIGTEERDKASGRHKEMQEAERVLLSAVEQQKDQANAAAARNAQDGDDATKPPEAMQKQYKDIKGSGEAHGELTEPHLLLSSPAGIAVTTPQNIHVASSEHTALSAGSNLSLAAAKSFMLTAMQKISLFAAHAGIKIFAAKEKLELQAQSGDLEAIADKNLRLISANLDAELGAKNEVLIHAGGSYIRLNSGGIEMGTNGTFTVYAASHKSLGPKSINKPFQFELKEWPNNTVKLDHRYHDDDPIQNAEYEALLADGSIRKGTLDSKGKAELTDVPPGPVKVRFGPDAREYTPVKMPDNPDYKAAMGPGDIEALVDNAISQTEKGGEK